MSDLMITETVICPKDSTEQDVGFCKGCDYYHGTSFNAVDCRYGEQLEDKLEEHMPKYKFEKLEGEDGFYLVAKRGSIAFKLRKKEVKKLDFHIPNTEIKEAKIKELFDIDHENSDFMEVHLSKYAVNGMRMIRVDGGKLGAVSSEFNWLWDSDVPLQMFSEGPEEPIYISDGKDVFAILMPLFVKDDNKAELEKLANLERTDNQ